MTEIPLYSPAAVRPPLDRLERRPVLRRWTMLKAVWRARRNLLEMFHPGIQARPWHVDDLGMMRLITVNDPGFARHVLSENAANYAKGPMYAALLGDFLGENASLLLNGEAARTRRRLLAPAFNARALRRLEKVIAREVQATVARWRAAGGEIALSDEAAMLAMRVAMEAFFSASLGARAAGLARLLDRTMTEAGTPSMADIMELPGWVPRRSRARVRALVAELDRELYALIDERRARASGDPGPEADLLDLLVTARDGETGRPLSREEVRNEVATLFIAGHETTALSLVWGLDRLAREPALQDRLADPWAAARRRLGRPFTAEEARALPLLPETYDEMLRLYPPVFAVARAALGPDRWKDVEIRAGDRVQIAMFMLHRASALWDAPETFDPERFREARHPAFAFLPFGGGPRICLGMGVAKTEAHLLIAEALAAFRLRPVGPPPEPMGKITLRTAAPVRLRLDCRDG
ncbi:MAG: cytochrome P450 [Paracoccaceae bacterium]